jgi:hypothetical protein
MHLLIRVVIALAAGIQAAPQNLTVPLWTDVTKQAIGTTGEWTNKVEIADIDNDGRPDLLFANGGN